MAHQKYNLKYYISSFIKSSLSFPQPCKTGRHAPHSICQDIFTSGYNLLAVIVVPNAARNPSGFAPLIPFNNNWVLLLITINLLFALQPHSYGGPRALILLLSMPIPTSHMSVSDARNISAEPESICSNFVSDFALNFWLLY